MLFKTVLCVVQKHPFLLFDLVSDDSEAVSQRIFNESPCLLDPFTRGLVSSVASAADLRAPDMQQLVHANGKPSLWNHLYGGEATCKERSKSKS